MLRHESPVVLLAEVHSVLVKFMHMLCGEAVSIQEVDELSFPPPLAIVDEEDEFLPLPAEDRPGLERALAAPFSGILLS